jgi:hypothetical protein
VALEPTGPISLGPEAGVNRSISGEFGGSTPHSLTEYYGAAAGVPSSGPISMGQLRGTSAQGYGTFTVNIADIDEDGAETVIFTLNTNNIPAASTVGFTTAGSDVALNGNDLLYSLDGTNYTDFNVTSGTLTISGGVYRIWVRAKADNFTEGTETLVINIASTDSNGINTGSPSASCDVNDTSLTPPNIPLTSDSNPSLETLTVLDASDIESGDDPEVISYCATQLRITRTASGFLIQGRMTDGDSCFYYPSNWPTSSSSSIGLNWVTLYTGNSGIAPDAFSTDGGVNWVSTPSTGSGFNRNAAAEATATIFSPESDNVSVTYTIWARKTGYADTPICVKRFDMSASAEAF